jgi:hypothetical protein
MCTNTYFVRKPEGQKTVGKLKGIKKIIKFTLKVRRVRSEFF